MHSQTYLAAACALLGAVAASPAQGGIETYTHIDYVTELVTSTVWVDASDPRANQTPAPVASASKAQHDVMSEHSHSHGDAHSHGHASSSSSSVYTAPSPPPAVPVAQSTSSHIVVAPSAPAVSSSSIVAPPPPPPATTLSTKVVAPAPVSPAAPKEPTTTTQPPVVATTSAVQTTATPAANNPAPPAASSSPAAATQGSSTGSGKTYNDVKLTFYGPEGGLGSCGAPIANTDIAVAISAATMDKATMCGKMISLSMPGHPDIQAKVVDTCPGCPAGGLDLTSSNTIAKGAETGAWAKLGLTNDLGPQYGASWSFI